MRPCDPHISWICTHANWLVCIANPTPNPIYIYGCRWFQVPLSLALPTLDQLTTAIDPAQFGGQWTSVPPPAGRVFCIPPWCRIYFRVSVDRWRPIIFQIAARNVPEEVLPLPTPPGVTPVPDPSDWNGEQGTMAILTTRATVEFGSDLTDPTGGPADGIVGISDFGILRTEFGQPNPDTSPPGGPTVTQSQATTATPTSGSPGVSAQRPSQR
jgi:hypothetical protein